MAATATLSRRIAGDAKSKPAGTCFAFRHRDCYLTASHCVGDAQPSDLTIIHVTSGPEADTAYARLVNVLSISRHESADVAVLQVDPAVAPSVAPPFPGVLATPTAGEDFVAFGFPEAQIGPNPDRPQPRVFKGHIQRDFFHESHLGYAYPAGELSVGCPAGLSGGPLFLPRAPDTVVALAAENVESSTGADFEEIVEGDTRTVYRRVLTYGVSVLLDPLRAWLQDTIPADTEWMWE